MRVPDLGLMGLYFRWKIFLDPMRMRNKKELPNLIYLFHRSYKKLQPSLDYEHTKQNVHNNVIGL